MARKIQVEIIGDSSSLERAFKRSGSAADSFSGKLTSAGRSAAKGIATAGVAASALAVTIGVKSVQAAANLGEQISKTGVVFGQSAKAIHKWATTTAGSIGISNRAALEAAGNFGNMLVPMGIARNEAASMSKRMVQLAADMASFNNASPEETLDALRAGLAGETEPLRRFGVFLNADRIAAEALSSGLATMTKDTTKIKVANLAVSKAVVAYTKSLKKHGAASKETQEDLIALEVAQDKLTKAMAGSAPKLTALQKAQATYNILLKDTADTQGDYERTSSGLPNLMRSIRASVEDLSAAFGEGLLPVVQKVAKDLQERLADPAFRERIRELGKEIGEKLLAAVEAIGTWFRDHWDEIKTGFRIAGDLAQGTAEAVGMIADAITNLLKIGAPIFKVFTTQFKLLLALASGLARALSHLPFIGGKFEGAAEAIDKIRESIRGFEKGLDRLTAEGATRAGRRVAPGRITGVQARAHGGPVMPGVPYRVGERGPETVTFGARGMVHPNERGGGGDIVINLDGREIARVALDHLRSMSRNGASQQRGRHAGHNLALT
jgi:hypothetical protein